MSFIQQFVDDYMLVVENDEYAWSVVTTIAQEENKDIFGVADRLRDGFEEQASALLDKLDPSHNNYIVNIMREMLLCLGTQPFENIAREVLARLDEGRN